MASVQERNGSYRVQFVYRGKLHGFTLGKVSEGEAGSKAAQVDYLLMRIRQDLIRVPDDADIVAFVRHDGRPPGAAGTGAASAARKPVTLAKLKDRYLETHGNGALEANSLATAGMHLRHFCRALGEAFPLAELTLASLQGYVNGRAKAKVSPVTIRKEVATFRAAWNWGGPMGLTAGAFPAKGLRYPKADEKPPFMTRAEVDRRIAGGGDPSVLWDCLYLQADEVTALLAHVRKRAAHPWLYPAVCLAAHTGARRSEILRALVADVDLAANVVTIREKKRSQSQRTTRRVPLTPFLKGVLKTWLAEHPGGPFLFCQAGVVARSKKRSATTGHAHGKRRPTSQKARSATVKRRPATEAGAITRDEFHDHFKRTLKGSKWEVVRGAHTLRHSFISACASKGVDQRLVQEWCGHMNEATSRRYRHLWPSVQQEAIRCVFD